MRALILHDWFLTFAAAWALCMAILIVHSWRESGKRFNEPRLVIDPRTQAYTHKWEHSTSERIARLAAELAVMLVIGILFWIAIISPILL